MIINRLDLPNCPYCGAHVWYIDAFLTKNKPLYKCGICKNKADVLIKPRAFKLLWIVQIVAIIIFVIAVLLGGNFSILGFTLIVILFTGFYGLTPYMVKLKHAITKRAENEDVYLKYNENIKKPSKEDTETDIYSN